ncbi:unnamed protein product [Diabrotica balteata]|uniref:CHK kinase-like domain-containing protein n=1 Tax=Diabrotica balteata TaxID=107213 RepID=A0A9N9SXK9_DIABA|nr:unnamed protein product [Diabrotica balteata]
MNIFKEHRALVDGIASENGFTDYEIITSSGSNKGDNFLGVLSAITIKNKEKSLDLILKASQTNKEDRESTPYRNLYNREIYLYEKIFKEFKKFQEEHNIEDAFESVPKFYSSFTEDGLESLIMENLKTQQYQMWDRKIPMNPGHIKAVLIEYAKFHAVSLAMKYKNPELFKELTEHGPGNPFENMFQGDTEKEKREQMKAFFTQYLSGAFKALRDNVVLTEYVKNFEQNLLPDALLKLQEPEYKLVITHGDCWCNNFMFKYQDTNDKTAPQSLRVIDWQMSSFGSPCTDISSFLLANSSQEVLDNFETYLKIYHDKLALQLRNFNLDPDEVFSLSRLQNHLKKSILLSLLTAFLTIKLMVTDPEPDHLEAVDKSADSEAPQLEEYSRRIKIVVRFMVKNKYL